MSVAWVLHQPGIGAAICGARNKEQAGINALAAQASLSAAEVERILSAFDHLPLRKPRTS